MKLCLRIYLLLLLLLFFIMLADLVSILFRFCCILLPFSPSPISLFFFTAPLLLLKNCNNFQLSYLSFLIIWVLLLLFPFFFVCFVFFPPTSPFPFSCFFLFFVYAFFLSVRQNIILFVIFIKLQYFFFFCSCCCCQPFFILLLVFLCFYFFLVTRNISDDAFLSFLWLLSRSFISFYYSVLLYFFQ